MSGSRAFWVTAAVFSAQLCDEMWYNPNMMKKKKAGSGGLYFYAVLITFISVILLFVSLFFAFRGKDEKVEKDEKEEEVEETIEAAPDEGDLFRSKLKEMAQSGYSMLQILKSFFPDDIVLTDEGRFWFFDVDDSLKKNSLKEEGFIRNDDGTVDYVENGVSKGKKGIDISKYNGEVDWEQVYASGVRFAYIRAGVRGYASGAIVKDDFFDDNITNAAAAGLETGTYFFSQAVDEEEARKEADFVLECVKDKKISCPIAYDLEKIENYDSPPRTKDLSKEQMTKNAIAFCERIKEAGYTPIIYGNIKTFMMLTELSELEGYQKWFADYISDDDHLPYYPYEMSIWQYSEKGSVPGVEGNCDLNIGFFEGE